MANCNAVKNTKKNLGIIKMKDNKDQPSSFAKLFKSLIPKLTPLSKKILTRSFIKLTQLNGTVQDL